MNKSKKYLKLGIKIAVSSVAIYYVASKLNFREIAVTIKYAEIWLLFPALIIYALSQMLAADRLNCLFRRIDLHLSFSENTKLYWLGLFYNLFLPGGVGGDGYKIFFLEKYLKPGIKNLLAIFFSDRISGLTAIGVFLVFFSYHINYKLPFYNFVWILAPIIILCFYFFIRIVNFSLVGAFFQVLWRAFIIQGLQMTTALIILFSLNSDISGNIGNYLFLFFISSVAGSVPISLGGIGIREITFLWGAQYLGIDENMAVALSLLFYVTSAVTALPGIIYSIRPEKILNKKIFFRYF